MSTFPIDEAYLIGGWIEAMLWGCFTMLLSTTLYTIHRKDGRPLNFTSLAIIMIYVLATAHTIIALVRLIQGFVLSRGAVDPVQYFAYIPTRINLAKDYLYITNLVLGDCVVVWRLYAVWGRDIRTIVLPALLVISEAAAGYGSCSLELLPTTRHETVARWGMFMYTISLITNVLVTAAVVLRIWYVARRAKLAGLGGVHYNALMLLIVESGALITAAKVVEFVLFELAPGDGLAGMNALYIVYECMPQITGIVPTLIVWAVNNGYTRPDEYYTESTADLAFASSTCGESTTVLPTAVSSRQDRAALDPTLESKPEPIVVSGVV